MFWIDHTLYAGRPSGGTGRLEAELACYDLLDELEIPYFRMDHDATASIDACAQVERELGAEICKNLFLCNRQKTDFYLLVMEGKKPFRTKDLSKQLGTARLSFGDPECMEEFLRITPGSVSLLGLMNDRDGRVQLVLDKAVTELEQFGCHPCINTSSLRLPMKDILEKFLPRVGHAPIVVELPWPEEE